MDQKTQVYRKDWDLLIILDACRYDYFKKYAYGFFEKCFDCKLFKAISPASHTYEWARKVLQPVRWKDVVYVSANPYINSRAPVRDLDLRNNFFYIYDAWLHDWDEELQTVYPDVLTKRAKELIETYPAKRFIVHYIQPHAPYIKQRIKGFWRDFMEVKENTKSYIPKPLRNCLSHIIQHYLPLPLLRWYWRYRIRKGVKVGGEVVGFAELSLKEWRKAYIDNLLLACKHVVQLIEEILTCYNKIVITADHGEMLGDRWLFGWKVGHAAGLKYKQLIEVPWLEIA